jgi:hypothetical protein
MATKRILLGVVMACVAFPVLALVAASGSADQADRDAITAVIEKSYFHGAFNELNPDAMRAGFHQDFAIFSAKGEEMAKLPIAAWAESVGKRKADPAFDPAKNVWAGKIVSLDVTGGAAAAKIELSRDGKLIYTDYLSLLKFSNGWRIAAKVYTDHR